MFISADRRYVDHAGALRGGTLDVPLTVPDSLQVNDLAVGLNLTHAQLSDLTVTLIAPDGTQILLLSGATGANLTNTVFDDNAGTPIQSGGAPFFATFTPQGAAGKTLASFAGVSANGTWTLVVQNSAATGSSATGTINGW